MFEYYVLDMLRRCIKMHFWSRVVLRVLTKSVCSKILKMNQNCNLVCNQKFFDCVSDCNFDPTSNCSNVHFWSRFEVRLCYIRDAYSTLDIEIFQILLWANDSTPAFIRGFWTLSCIKLKFLTIPIIRL